MKNYEVMTWSGSGYRLNEYPVQAGSFEEAYELGIGEAIKDNGILHFNMEEALEYFNEFSDEEKELFDNYHNYFSINSWRYYQNEEFEGFVYTENLRIVEVDLQKEAR